MTSVPATNTEATARWVCGLLQAGDSFYPTGSYAHSLGLEGLIQANVIRDRDTLRIHLFASAIPALERIDLPLIAHAWRALGVRDWARVEEVSVLSSALKTAQEIRTASEKIGRQRAELCAALNPNSIASDYLDEAHRNGWPFAAPVSAAVEALAVGAPLLAALSAYGYSSLSGQLAAAMKLLRLGQNGAQSLLTEALDRLPAAVTLAQEVSLSDVGWFNPWLDIAAARHETAPARMFIS